MSEERIPQLISVYRALLLKSRPAYIRRARFFLFVPNLLAGGIALLPVLLFAAGTFVVAWLHSFPLLLLLLFFASISLPVIRILSFRRTVSRTSGIFLTEHQKPSTSEGIILGLVSFMILAGTAHTFRDSPTVHLLLTLFGAALLLYVFQIPILLWEVFRYYTSIPVSEGIPITAEPERRLREEYLRCTEVVPEAPAVRRFFLTSAGDLQIGVVTVGGVKKEEKKGGSQELREEQGGRSRFFRNSLALSLPLLQSVTTEQLHACLLSECLSHTTEAGRLFHRYTDRYVAWSRLLYNLSNSFHWGEKLYLPFNSAVHSCLTAHLFLLSRIARQEADQTIAESGYRIPLLEGLANQAYKHRLIEKSVWSNVYRRADSSGDVHLDPFAAIQGELSGEYDREEAKLVLNESMIHWNDGVALVPPASERLAMLHAGASVPEQHGESAAEYYFGEQIKEVIGAADTSWNRTFFTTYGELLARRQEAREELEGVLTGIEEGYTEEGKEKGALFWRAGQIREGLASEDEELDAALDLYRHALLADPDSSLHRFTVARMLLARNREEGLDLLHDILGSDEMGEERLYAYRLVLEHLRNKGMEHEAKMIEEEHHVSCRQAEERLNLYSRHAQLERRTIKVSDTFLDHGLDRWALRHLLRILGRYRHVLSAVLVRKQIFYFPEYPLYLLGLEIERPPAQRFLDPGGRILYAQRVAEEFQFLRGGVGVLLLHPYDPLSQKLQQHPGGEVYRRKE